MPEPTTNLISPAPQPVATTAHTVQPVPERQPWISETAQAAGFILVMGALIAMLWRVFNVVRDVKEVQHKLNNQVTRIDVLEKENTDKTVRLVRVEEGIATIKETQARIEKKLDDHFAELAESIREMRVVAPRR